ncbi:MAG: hypothetical protein JRG82_16695 [Deltaproteobacteria bacterium]|nr:hypothetical protein [Deltaproteobacteria bacterium]
MNFQAVNDMQLGLLVVFLAGLLAGPRLRGLSGLLRWRDPALAVLAAASLFAYLNAFEMHGALGASHPFEFYHYYVGAAYFPELGYTGLYEASVIADLEDDPEHFDPRARVLNQRTYEYERRGQVRMRADEIKARFTPERWIDFKRDIAYFRSRAPQVWRSSRLQRDHGYNGTPVTTALLGGLARLVPAVPVGSFISAAAWLDPLIVLGAGAWIARMAGLTAGLLFVFLWAVNPFNAYGYTGGAYLRHLWLVAFALSIVCLSKGRAAISGALAALAAGLALFPALPVAALAARDLLRPDRVARLRERAPFWAALVGTGLALLLSTSLLSDPGPDSPWLAFRESIGVHAGALSPNHVGLASVFAFSPSHDLRAIEKRGPEGRVRDWRAESLDTLDSRSLAYRAVQLCFLVGIVLFLRGATPVGAWFAGLAAIYAFVPLSHYYWAVLCTAPLCFGFDRRSLVLLAGFWLGVTLLRQVDALDDVLDRLMFAVSALAGVYFAVALGDGILRARSAATSGGPAR